jgi:hypothetical protein
MRKTLIVISIIISSLLLILGGSVLVLCHHRVQTSIANCVASNLSERLAVDVNIGKIHYKPLSRLIVDSIYMSDQQNDTLFFVEQLNTTFHPLQLLDKRLDITQVTCTRPFVNIQSPKDSTPNFQFLLDLLNDTASFSLRVNVDTLEMIESRLRYNSLLIDRMNLALAMPIFSADSMDITIHNLSMRAKLDQLDAAFEAQLHGGLDSIFADDLKLTYRNKQLFSGDIAVFSPMELDSLYVQANCNDLYCNYALLRDILSQLQVDARNIPNYLLSLGDVHYKGDINGRFEDMFLHGTFSTALGRIQVNGNLQIDSTLTQAEFLGDISSSSFQLGKLVNNVDLGEIAFNANIDGNIDTTSIRHCIANANIQHIEYLGYTYQDILFDGELRGESVSGNFSIKDENINITINGLANWSKKDTRLDITAHLENLCPNAIHLTDKYPEMTLNTTAYISLSTFGKQWIDNLSGHIIIDSLEVQNGSKQAVMEQMKLLIDNDIKEGKKHHRIQLQSDFVTANVSGAFQYTTLASTVQKMLNEYLPSLVTTPKKRYRQPNELTFYAYFRQLEKVSEVLDLDISLPHYPTIKGLINERTEEVQLQAYVPNINTTGTNIKDLTIALNNPNDALDLSVYMYNCLPQNNPTAAKIGDVKAHINVNAQDDNIGLQIRLDNTDSVRNEGIINVSSKIARYANKPLFNIHVHPTDFLLNDSAWNISESQIIYNVHEQRMHVDNFSLSTEYQTIAFDGTGSKHVHDSIQVQLQNIDIQYLLGYTQASNAISVQGPLTGWATLYGLFSQPMIEAQVIVPNGGLNGTYLGDIFANAYWDRNEKAIMIEGQAIDSTAHIAADVRGKVIPADKWWGLDINCDSINISLIDFWTNGFFSNPQGRAFGNVQVSGRKQKVWVIANVLGKDAQLTIPHLGSTFYFSDTIHMDSTSIRIPKLAVYDSGGNEGYFEGIITHNNFTNFNYQLRAHAEKMLVMDLPYDPQALFYGKVYGTGDVNINGDDYKCKIAVNAKTEDHSKFYLSVNTASIATSSSFVDFVSPDSSSYHLLNILNNSTKTEKQSPTKRSRTLLSLQIEATPTTDIHIKMGGDDGIIGRGEGNVQINYDDASEEISMLGTYTLQSGLFSFSLGNIVRRNFDIAEGSSVTWSGDPLSPNVDITGRYHTTASLRDLFGSDLSQVSTNRTSVPVNCLLHMSDQLFNPTLQFAVELPQSDESVQSQINSIINTEEMLMRQVIYLLVFNRFYTPDYLKSSQAVGLNETYSLLSSTITGQINTWLSKLTNVFTMGFNFRTDGEGETASQEYEANFQLRPINQLIINGNFGYRYNDISNRPFFGDLDVEYLLIPSGKLRAKAFTHTVDKYSLKQANTVQGIGLVFKHDFNIKRKSKQDTDKADTTPIPLRKDTGKKRK